MPLILFSGENLNAKARADQEGKWMGLNTVILTKVSQTQKTNVPCVRSAGKKKKKCRKLLLSVCVADMSIDP